MARKRRKGSGKRKKFQEMLEQACRVWWTHAPNGKQIEIPANARRIVRVKGDIAVIMAAST